MLGVVGIRPNGGCILFEVGDTLYTPYGIIRNVIILSKNGYGYDTINLPHAKGHGRIISYEYVSDVSQRWLIAW